MRVVPRNSLIVYLLLVYIGYHKINSGFADTPTRGSILKHTLSATKKFRAKDWVKRDRR